ncbi:hypothetical protein [Acinetobacter seifertii]|nr:hypothetical protein [Acinetobacter seifertii]QNX53563.1 hypothetical protein IC783_06565 [Acinetobacter seifertii]QNX53617.1 hypothetical protein IC783_06860 [Acinetobacter seifertii]QNX54795.1 hypothetical protein IC783_22470 [Acinetobacter seifertii]QNX84841.1 hypothetical protein IC774_06555 [Acinetobacter seifertii]QNX84891.1 hypothetical protein IC774_06855 [Acinetobacter seifertii]
MAIGPIDYRLDVADPFNQAMQGYQLGMQATATNAALQAQKVEEERKKQAFLQQQLRQKQMQAKRNEIITKGANLNDVQNFILEYPEFSKPYEPILNNLENNEKRDLFLMTRGAYNAIENNRPDIAKSEMERLAQAYENSGKPDWAANTRQYANAIDTNPRLVKYQLGGFSALLDPNAVKTTGEEQRANEMQPYQIKDIQAKTAQTQAQTNDIPLAAEDRRTGVNNQNKKIEYDNQYNYDKLGQDWKIELAKMSQQEQIEAAKLRATKNETSVQRMERIEKAQNFANTASTAASTAKLAADLIADYKKLSDASGAGVWNAAWRNVPGSAEYDFSRRVDTLKSQAFLIGAQSLKGLGAMTEMEGKKVTDALGNLDLNQNTGQVVQQLAAIAKAANSVAQHSNRNAQNYATKGYGYSKEVVDTAKARGVSPAEMQKIANELGIH